MEQTVNQKITNEINDQLSAAVRYVNYALTSLEADPNYTEECTKLWRIYQSLVSFQAKFQFLNRIGVWSFLATTSV